MASIVRDLVANHAHNIGHRRLVKDEVWARMQFRDQADLTAFAGLLRWSAFRFQEPAAPATQQQPAATQEQPSKPKR
jgi:hypothetical protein